MTILLHAHYEETEDERAVIALRVAEHLADGAPPAVASALAVEEFIEHHLPNNVHLVLAEELG